MPAGYHEIAADLRTQIRAGSLAPGDRLPGIRAIADRWQVSEQTANAAIRSLAGEGLVAVEHGRATRVVDPLPPAGATVAELEQRVHTLERRVQALEQRDGHAVGQGDGPGAGAAPGPSETTRRRRAGSTPPATGRARSE